MRFSTAVWLRAARVAAVCAFMGAGAACFAAELGDANGYPSHTVKLIVPTAPGGSIDITARLLAEKLFGLWKQPVIVENRPGASMMIGAEAVARAQPDGYTLMIVHDGAMSINAAVYPKLRYSPSRDFASISMICSIPLVMLANPSFEAKSVTDLIALARKKPGTLNHANGGPGTMLPSQLFKSMAEIEYAEVPFKGASLAISSTIAGDTQFTIADLTSAGSFIKSGRLRPIGIATSERNRGFPDLPTISEQGVPGYQVSMWIGAFAPAGTPQAIVAKIEGDIRRVLQDPKVRSKMEELHMTPIGSTGADLAAAMSRDTARWSKLVKDRSLAIDQ